MQLGSRLTMVQWHFKPQPGRVRPDLFPVTLPEREARQAVKLILAASTINRNAVVPYLPQMNLSEIQAQLVYLPWVDNDREWMQADSGVIIDKTIFNWGRVL